jgi:hypothetical protein
VTSIAIGLERRHGGAELGRLEAVVGVEHGHIGGRCGLKAGIARLGGAAARPARAQVVDAGVADPLPSQHRRVVGPIVRHHDQQPVGMGLGEDALDRANDHRLGAIGGHDDGNRRLAQLPYSFAPIARGP